jgi:hypothetical protein
MTFPNGTLDASKTGILRSVNERVLRSASDFENWLKISSWESSARAGGDDRLER